MKKLTRLLSLVVIFLACSSIAPGLCANTWYVDGSVPASGDGTSWGSAFATIQDGIDAATNGDTVIVAPGTYVENVRFNGKNLILRSTDPLDAAAVGNTVIDGNQAGSVVTFSGTEHETCVLSGFTIRNGTGLHDSGVKGSTSVGLGDAPRTHATIRNNVITGNSTWWHGGGITWCGGTIENNTIIANSAISQYSGGGGIAWCNGTIQDNVIVGNSATGQYSWGGGLAWCDAVIRNNVIAGNTANYLGGGLWGCGGAIHNNTIVGNAAGAGGGLSSCMSSVMNCIIWGNTAPSAAQLHDSVAPIHSCMQGWTGGGEGNISEDPKFVDLDGGDDAPLTYADNDYHLAPDSPCIDAGNPDPSGLSAEDYDGNPRLVDGDCDGAEVVDMGAYEYQSVCNNPPVADAGRDQEVECTDPTGTSVVMDGSGSYDPDGDEIEFLWTWSGSQADGVSPEIRLPLGMTTVTLVVTDCHDEHSAPDNMNVLIADTTPPQVTITSPEEGRTYINTQGSVPVTYSVSDVGDPSPLVEVFLDGDPIAGVIELGSLSFGTHELTVVASDASGNVGEATVTFEVQPEPLTSFVIGYLRIDWPRKKTQPDKLLVGGSLQLPNGYSSADLVGQVELALHVGDRTGSDAVSCQVQARLWTYGRQPGEPPDGENLEVQHLRLQWDRKNRRQAQFEATATLAKGYFNDGSGRVTLDVLLPVKAGGDVCGARTVQCRVTSLRWVYP